MSQTVSQFYFSLGATVICIKSALPLRLTDVMRRFRVEPRNADVTIHVKIMTDPIPLPPAPCGDDLLLNYYRDGDHCCAVAKPGLLGPLTTVVYTPDFSESTVYVNEAEHPGIVRTIEKVLQLFPIRQLLTKFHMMVIHASQIAVGNKGILFTAPSGTGKSTQAGLWNQYEQAEIICNDRTLLRDLGDSFVTYGYPIDGSTPVCSNSSHQLGAIAVLRQGNENQIQRLPPGKALKYLMEQTVIDVWNQDEINIVRQQWMDVICSYPVYLLTCRPDRGAVACLKEQLQRDGVI